MSPYKSTKKTIPQARSEASRSESSTMDDWQSQSQDNTTLQELMRLRSERDKNRRRKRKAELLATHNETMSQLRAKAEHLVKAHDEQVRAIRRPGADKLLQLLRRKQETESKLSACEAQLEVAYLNASKHFQRAVGERIHDWA